MCMTFFRVQAAEQGYPDAYFYLGIMNLRGLGMRRKSFQRAYSYLTLAAHVGHVQVGVFLLKLAFCVSSLQALPLAQERI